MLDLIDTTVNSNDLTAILARITLKIHPDPLPTTLEERALARAAAWTHRAPT